MRFSHEDIKEKLPEYIREGLIPDEVKAHLRECKECSQEVSLLWTLNKASVPEPGDMFFETLPQKVKASLNEKKKSVFFGLAPAFALIALVVVAGYIYYMMKIPQEDEGFLFSDPFAPQVYDLSGLNADDIPSIASAIKEDEIYFPEETPFLREFASLSSEEMEDLYEALNIEKEKGGVL